MTKTSDPQSPQIAQWLSEGVSIETHTAAHPCPLLQKGNLAAAKATFDQSVDRIPTIPNNRPVAFRMPCCDSMNSVSPRFFAEIFNRTTPQGSSWRSTRPSSRCSRPTIRSYRASVSWMPTGRATFAKYVPTDKQMVNVVTTIPIRTSSESCCWEFPCLMPSDWDAFHLHGKCNPLTCATGSGPWTPPWRSKGVFALCFHPHGWIDNSQIVELIDYAQRHHGGKVKFLSFRDVAERLTKHLLAENHCGTPRAATTAYACWMWTTTATWMSSIGQRPGADHASLGSCLATME